MAFLDDNAILHCLKELLTGDSRMTVLSMTTQGQVTFRKDVLHHLGITPGNKIAMDKLPGRPAGISLMGWVNLKDAVWVGRCLFPTTSGRWGLCWLDGGRLNAGQGSGWCRTSSACAMTVRLPHLPATDSY